MKRQVLFLALAALLAPACAAPYAQRPATYAEPNQGPGLVGWVQARAPQETPLFARDGGVVDATAEPYQPHHGPEPTGTGRMYLLELYQQAIDDRDALELEMKAVDAALQRTQGALDEALAQVAAMEVEVQRLSAEHADLQAENLDLAGRLTTAQIRRLEAEKLLLEARIAEHRSRETVPSPPAETGGRP